jgi:hypothetical protein
MSSIYEVQIMGITHLYWLPPNLPVPENIKLDKTWWHIRYHQLRALPKELFQLEDMRTIIIKTWPEKKLASIQYLIWLEPTDLELLDEKIVSGKYYESDFADAVFTYYHKVICIDNCKRKWHTLVADRIEAHISNTMGQNMAKLDNYDFPSCPHCQTRFRIPVVKILGHAE